MPATSIAGFASLPEHVRAFIALRLEAAVDAAIAGLTERLRAPENGNPPEGIRWVRRANFHLTLFFLGPTVPRERLAPIADALGAIAQPTAPFEIEARGVGAFPNAARPRVIFVGLHGDALAGLAARVAEAAERCGFAPERRVYSPHLTVGRVRSLRSPARLRRALSEAAESSFGVSRIERVILYRSERGPQSSTYHELAAFPFV
ncbi:MAG TPA: RNA 2',3'-cyclic phosphodiesterase [Candidatus Binataceae bacterium]|nr:RNA 2',3'-cyclic phosphodiesterase [Candidatus Binataceae bacterium]